MNGKVQLNSRIEDSIKRELARTSKLTGLTMETIIRDALQSFVGVSNKVIDSQRRLVRSVIDRQAFNE